MRPDDGWGRQRPTPFWEKADDAGDPSLIILRATQGRSAPEEIGAMPDDAKHRALLRAGFRSHAENLLMASLGRRPADGTPEQDAVLRALDETKASFGPIDTATETDTRDALNGMMTAIRGRARRRVEELRVERALDALEAEADDLLAALRRDPDSVDEYSDLLKQSTDRFAPGLEPEALDVLRDNLGREAAQMRILGLIDQERFDDARVALNHHGPALPEGQPAWLERSIAVAERAAEQRAHAERLAAAEEATRLLVTGEMPESSAGLRSTASSPLDQRRLELLRKDIETREAVNDARVAAASDAAAGHGWAATLPRDERALAAELYWQRIGRGLVAELDTDRRPGVVAMIVSRLEEVPMAMRSRIRFGLGQGAGAAVRLETARWLTTILHEAPWSIPAFSEDERRFADYVVQALESGVYEGREAEALTWADRHVPLQRPTGTVTPAEREAIRHAATSGFGPFASVRRALEGGRPLDPDHLDDNLLAAVYWRETHSGTWHHASPGTAAEKARDFVLATLIMPASLLADVRTALSGDDAVAAERAARTVAVVIDALPEQVGFLRSFELARANLISQAVEAGTTAEDALRLANERHPVPDPVTPEPPDDAVVASTIKDAAIASWGAGLLLLLSRPPAAPLIGGTMKGPVSYDNFDSFLDDLYKWSPLAVERLLVRIAANPDVSDPRSPDGIEAIRANQVRYGVNPGDYADTME